MKRSFPDFLGREVIYNYPPKRIVSLVPSQTELLFDLGLDEEIVGVTKFCVHPVEKTKQKAIVGGTKNLRIEKIIELNPDLIIANKEENVKEHIEELDEEFPVWVSDVKDFEGAQILILALGHLTFRLNKAWEIREDLQLLHEQWQKMVINRRTVIYLIWRKPYMVAGRDTFIDSMLEVAGYKNIIHQARYPVITIEEMRSLNPDLIFLSSEPFPFTEKHIKELDKELPKIRKLNVNGEYFSWYGSRMLSAFRYFRELMVR